MAETEATQLVCDTCGKPTKTVSRVVVDAGYNRANSRAVYNSPECYEKKLQKRLEQQGPSEAGAAGQR